MSKASHITRAACDVLLLIYLIYTSFHSSAALVHEVSRLIHGSHVLVLTSLLSM